MRDKVPFAKRTGPPQLQYGWVLKEPHIIWQFVAWAVLLAAIFGMIGCWGYYGLVK